MVPPLTVWFSAHGKMGPGLRRGDEFVKAPLPPAPIDFAAPHPYLPPAHEK